MTTLLAHGALAIRNALVALFVLVAAARPASGGQWVPIGPPGASISAIAVDPSSPSVVLAAAPGAAGAPGTGAYRSADGGSTWTLTSGLPHDVSQVSYDVATPATVWVLTVSNGLFKSVDGGATWAAVVTGQSAALHTALAVDPSTSGTAYAGAGGLVLKTTDGGANWTTVYTPAGVPVPIVFALGVDPSTPATVYASVLDSSNLNAIVQSTDGGGSWNPVTPPMLGPARVDFFGFDVVNPGTVYAAGSRLNVGPGGFIPAVYVSPDSGGTWSEVHPSGNDVIADFAVDTTGAPYAIVEGGILTSSTGGSSWTPLADIPGADARALGLDPTSATTLHVGSVYGPFKSTNGGATWQRSVAGMDKASIFSLAADPLHAGEMVAKWLNGPLLRTTDGGSTWNLVGAGLARDAHIFPQAIRYDPTASGRVYAAIDSLAFPPASMSIHKSTDGGLTFTPSTPMPTPFSLAIDPFDPNVLYAGSYKVGVRCEATVWRSVNEGATWTQVFNDDAGCEMRTIACDPMNPGTLYAGAESAGAGGNGEIYRSVNGGTLWAPRFLEMDMHQLFVSPQSSQTLYARVKDGALPLAVVKTTDGGTIWNPAQSGLPASPVIALMMDPANGSLLYAAVDGSGVYRSTDGAASWSPMGSFPAGLYVQDLVADPITPGRVYAATRERGILAYVPVCGDGVAEGGEVCDDGNANESDCCSSSCTAINAGQACDDGVACTSADVCTGGMCAGTPGGCPVCGNGMIETPETCDDGNNLDGDCCSSSCAASNIGQACEDGDPCSSGQTCAAGACGGGTVASCGLCEVCNPTGGCLGAPRNDCRQSLSPGKSKLTIKNNADDARDLVIWKYLRGDGLLPSALGDPTTGADYALCMFAGPTETPIFLSRMPAGGTCGSVSCWKSVANGYKYLDTQRTPDGTHKLLVKAGAAYRSKAIYKGAGVNLSASPYGMPAPQLTTPIRVQLQFEGGACYEASYLNPTKNEPGMFKSNSD